LTLAKATPTVSTHKKKKCTFYPCFFSSRINLNPDNVVSKAKVSLRREKKLISLSISLPARTAAASGEKGDIPCAIKSALMKFLQSAYFGRKVLAKVVLPTPFGPAMM